MKWLLAYLLSTPKADPNFLTKLNSVIPIFLHTWVINWEVFWMDCSRRKLKWESEQKMEQLRSRIIHGSNQSTGRPLRTKSWKLPLFPWWSLTLMFPTSILNSPNAMLNLIAKLQWNLKRERHTMVWIFLFRILMGQEQRGKDEPRVRKRRALFGNQLR